VGPKIFEHGPIIGGRIAARGVQIHRRDADVLQSRHLDNYVGVANNGHRPPFIVIIDVEGWAATTAVCALIFGVRRGTKNI
jgi:hypothetical protein